MITLRKKDAVLYIVLTGLFLFFCIFQTYLHKQEEFNEISNELYTNHHKVLINQGDDRWLKELSDSDCRIFAEYNSTYRALLKNSGEWSPPIRSGHYFLETDQGRKAVVGNEMRKQVYERGGNKYITFQGVEYEVTGFMGASFASSIDYLVLLINPELPNIPKNTRIIVDGDNESTVEELVEKVVSKNPLISQIESTQKGVTRTAEVSFFNFLLFVEMCILILFTITAFIRYWYEKEKKTIRVLFLLGVSKRKIYQQIINKSLLIVIFSSISTFFVIYIFDSFILFNLGSMILLTFIFLFSVWLLLSLFFYNDHAKGKVTRNDPQ
ncbi:hypothetical protein [Paenibacillus barengoltzii]|uniref:MacB-like periplasmic core domain-containing protein n=1 Tax=Paenibacillus barengoltzii G22 TaxID=1235795 RepID=R9LBD4_9BACL|nr:hypothetical protein [Paenibacillus barengoltzii]EOS56094.1 hypothetical protein C812_02156 [Paenibacillus barengoltzii G22]